MFCHRKTGMDELWSHALIFIFGNCRMETISDLFICALIAHGWLDNGHYALTSQFWDFRSSPFVDQLIYIVEEHDGKFLGQNCHNVFSVSAPNSTFVIAFISFLSTPQDDLDKKPSVGYVSASSTSTEFGSKSWCCLTGSSPDVGYKSSASRQKTFAYSPELPCDSRRFLD